MFSNDPVEGSFPCWYCLRSFRYRTFEVWHSWNSWGTLRQGHCKESSRSFYNSLSYVRKTKVSSFELTKNNQTFDASQSLGILLQKLMKDVLKTEKTQAERNFSSFFCCRERNKQTKKKQYGNESPTLKSIKILLLATITDVTLIIATLKSIFPHGSLKGEENLTRFLFVFSNLMLISSFSSFTTFWLSLKVQNKTKQKKIKTLFTLLGLSRFL